MIIIRHLLITFLLLLTAGTAHAQLPGAPLSVPATLEAETVSPAPGKTVTLAFVMTPKPGWHGYWENPGDAGFGMQLTWDLPKGVRAGKLRYPVPGTLIISGLMNYVFEEKHVLLVDLTIDPTIATGTRLPVKVRGDWLGCTTDICVPQGDDLLINLVAGDGAITPENRSRFDGYRSVIPVPLDQPARYSVQGKSIDIAIPFPKTATLDHPYFFPLTGNVFNYSAPQSARRVGDWLVIRTGLSGTAKGSIDGMIRIGKGQGLLLSAKPGAVPADGDPIAVLGKGIKADATPALDTVTFGGILGLLGLSILGGLILNLMPCVFPILGLKALALAKAGGDEAVVRRDALAYSGGVVLSCLALGGVMLALRAGGEQVGWAFQLQDPVIVLVLALLMVAVTANLAGVFELASVQAGDALTRQDGMAGSFWTGVLAAIVATPCTGPFMAAAMGAALLLPVLLALLLFVGLGLGLALPFLALAYIPALRRRMPKPGPWLNRFRRIMAIPMGLTAVALLWLLWRLSGEYALFVGVAACVLLLITLALAGKYTYKKWSAVTAAAVVVGLTVTAGLFVRHAPVESRTEAQGVLKSEPFSEVRLNTLRNEGRRVFVYFTADWCVTCKVNEAAAIEREDVKRAFAGNAVTVLKGDFTRRDPAISRFLAQHGRSGVPLYLYYPKGGEPQVLPQVLTSGTLTALR